MAKFKTLLQRAGFETYDAYLAGDHWLAFGQRYRSARDRPQKCAVCGDEKFQLHHVNYKNLGHEKLGDVMPLCAAHHYEVHQWLKDRNLFVKKSKNAVRAIRQSLGLAVPNDKYVHVPKRRPKKVKSGKRTKAPKRHSSMSGKVPEHLKAKKEDKKKDVGSLPDTWARSASLRRVKRLQWKR